MIPTVQLDTRNFMRAFEVLHRNSKTQPTQALAKAVAFVVADAKSHTPSESIGQIDTELAVEVTPRIGKRGKPLSQKKAANKDYKVNGLGQRGDPDVFPEIPISWLIIGARAKPGSKFNQSNSNRWFIAGGHPLKGQKVANFANVMNNFIGRMVRGRHQTPHFFEQSWNGILVKLVPMVPTGFRKCFRDVAGKQGQEMSTAEINGGGTSLVSIAIHNQLGMAGEYPKLDEQRNLAAKRILLPILQDSINRNFDQQMKIAGERGLLDSKTELMIYGFY